MAKSLSSESRQNFFKFIDSNSAVIIKNKSFLKDQLDQLFDKAEKSLKIRTERLNNYLPKHFC